MATKKKSKEPLVEEPYKIEFKVGIDMGTGGDASAYFLLKRENGKFVMKKQLLAQSEMGRHRESLLWIKANE